VVSLLKNSSVISLLKNSSTAHISFMSPTHLLPLLDASEEGKNERSGFTELTLSKPRFASPSERRGGLLDSAVQNGRPDAVQQGGVASWYQPCH
jgi:hypothetical protein